jgi:acetate kinase
MREVLARAAGGDDPEARLALDVHAHRLAGGIAAMAASLRGLDAVVFTGGVGEAAPAVRLAAAQRLAFLGIGIDEAANGSVEGDADVSAEGAAVRTLVVPAREDLEIARQVRALLGAST